MRAAVSYCTQASLSMHRPVSRQMFIRPAGLFSAADQVALREWSCVRTRPRWEKKFANWLATFSDVDFFMPVLTRHTESGGKRREALVPLFPGYVFVGGRHGKGDFDRTGMVVYVLNPEGPQQVAQLHLELAGVWHGLNSGCYVEPVHGLSAGEMCVIMRGPLEGQTARFERVGRQGRVVLQVEMMGGGLVVDVPVADVAVPQS